MDDKVPSSYIGVRRSAQPLGASVTVTSRQLVSAIFTVVLVGCAVPKSEWKSAGYHVTNQRVLGCDSFEGKKGTAMKQTALLSLNLQRRLLALLNKSASEDEKLRKHLDDYRDHLMCWYETPDNDIQLSLGEFCDSPLEIEFRQHSGEWQLMFAERAIVECMLLPPNTSLERTRDG